MSPKDAGGIANGSHPRDVVGLEGGGGDGETPREAAVPRLPQPGRSGRGVGEKAPRSARVDMIAAAGRAENGGSGDGGCGSGGRGVRGDREAVPRSRGGGPPRRPSMVRPSVQPCGPRRGTHISERARDAPVAMAAICGALLAVGAAYAAGAGRAAGRRREQGWGRRRSRVPCAPVVPGCPAIGG